MRPKKTTLPGKISGVSSPATGPTGDPRHFKGLAREVD
jgi:hypothetical protein